MLQEAALDVEFEEDVEALLEVNEPQEMPAGNVHGALRHRQDAEGTTEQVYLCMLVYFGRGTLVCRRIPSRSKPVCLN